MSMNLDATYSSTHHLMSRHDSLIESCHTPHDSLIESCHTPQHICDIRHCDDVLRTNVTYSCHRSMREWCHISMRGLSTSWHDDDATTLLSTLWHVTCRNMSQPWLQSQHVTTLTCHMGWLRLVGSLTRYTLVKASNASCTHSRNTAIFTLRHIAIFTFQYLAIFTFWRVAILPLRNGFAMEGRFHCESFHCEWKDTQHNT